MPLANPEIAHFNDPSASGTTRRAAAATAMPTKATAAAGMGSTMSPAITATNSAK